MCIYGAGAIGGYLAVQLARTGVDVSVVARGPHLRAIRESGLKLRINGEVRSASIPATDNPAELDVQDYVIVALKAQSVATAARSMQPLLGPQTAVVTASNGVPWWYFYTLPGPWEGHRLESVDPGGVLWELIGPERAIGCVVYPACDVAEPGIIEHLYGDRFTLGEPGGEKTDRVKRLSELLIEADLKAPIRNIRDEIWIKLWGNLCFNPISALTHATLDVIATESPGTRDISRLMMREAQAIGEKLGIRFGVDIEKRINGAAAVGAHKTSMLQDLERNRPMEIDALVTAVQEMGHLVNVPTPTIDVVLALVRQRARIAECY